MDFIAFDLETTGIVAGVDQIVEIGAVLFINGTIESVFSTLINPKKRMPAAATAVNGITDSMLSDKPTIEAILNPFAEFCAHFPLVAHNANFDSQFLIADIKKHESLSPKGIVLDTLPIARKTLPGLANYKLGTLVQHLKIPSNDFHRAEADAIYCGKLFLELIHRISQNGEAPPIENLVALTGKSEFRFPIVERSPKQLDLFSL